MFLVGFMMFCCSLIENGIQGSQIIPYPTELQNKSFDESDYFTMHTIEDSNLINEEQVPGWSLSTHKPIKICREGILNPKPHSGKNFDSLDSDTYSSGMLGQTLLTDEGALYSWSFWHYSGGAPSYAVISMNNEYAVDNNNTN
ncbi:hypothetical protein AZF37_09025 [endosymbiont 'TC1' of Trimyema compressum]|uniref:hypothetical protein n=1 Tax=endosymbiont 'TC1' of Trimyema compressum TaxID=243899 RepID=UPI0007F054CE|nr:hypothetical protein [endosymbiont 'TC1' of Trimyema compressum]AMP21265.1 hypothetical protein AZF37_09025 [endosymbiont 'TC1' of Trimyema compressum]